MKKTLLYFHGEWHLIATNATTTKKQNKGGVFVASLVAFSMTQKHRPVHYIITLKRLRAFCFPRVVCILD